MFKNWLEGDLQDAINDYGPEIIDDVKLPIRGYTFLERFLEAIILANTDSGFFSEELHKRKVAAMKALVGEKPPRIDKRNEMEGLVWMAEQYMADQAEVERGRLEKVRSSEALAYDYAISDSGEIDNAMADRLRRDFSTKKRDLLKMVDDTGNASPLLCLFPTISK